MEKGTSNNDSLVDSCIKKAPLALDSIRSTELLNYVETFFLPYSIGIEIECNELETYNIEVFKSIPNIMAVNSSSCEQRFRIPKGLDGLICLYNISLALIDNCSLNRGSGIHYHIDMTDCYSLITNEFIAENNDWIIDDLAKWGTARDRESSKAKCSRVRGWVRYDDGTRTLEVRIGEMTFDYTLIAKRIFACCDIVRTLKNKLGVGSEASNKLKKLRSELLELNSLHELTGLEMEMARTNVKKRVIRV